MCDTLNVQKLDIEVSVQPDSLPTVAYVTIGVWDLKIKGFRLVQKGDTTFLTPPSYRNRRGGYTPFVFLEDEEKWELLQTLALARYRVALRESEEVPFPN